MIIEITNILFNVLYSDLMLNGIDTFLVPCAPIYMSRKLILLKITLGTS